MEREKKHYDVGPIIHNHRYVPFTGGIILFVYAFFWPDGYGTWLGTIVGSFRKAAGF